MSAGALPQAPLGDLQRSPDPLAGFKGPLRGIRGMEGKEGKGRTRGGENEERRGMVKGGERGKLGGNSTLVVWGIDAPGAPTAALLTRCHLKRLSF